MKAIGKSSRHNKPETLNVSLKRPTRSPYGCSSVNKPYYCAERSHRSRRRSQQILRENECYGKSKSSSCQGTRQGKGSVQNLLPSKKPLGENRLVINIPDARAQPLCEKKRLELNRDRTRTKLIDARFETDGRWSFEIKHSCNLLQRVLQTPDDLRFMNELNVFFDVLKSQRLGQAEQLIEKLLLLFERKEAILVESHKREVVEQGKLLLAARQQVSQLSLEIATLKNELEVLTESNRCLKAQLQEKTVGTNQSVLTNTGLTYTIKLEEKIKESRDQKQRFMKILRVLYNRGIDFRELQRELEEQEEEQEESEMATAANMLLINRRDNHRTRKLQINDSSSNLADNSIVNDSQQSSFNFAGKPQELDFFECKRVYKNDKPIPEELRNRLKVDMDVLYESESSQSIPTV